MQGCFNTQIDKHDTSDQQNEGKKSMWWSQ
jgi:hypothetical protein